MKKIPFSEIKLSFARSSGPGGQNVNKVSSKVIVHWSIIRSAILTEAEKHILFKKLYRKINTEGELVLSSESERSQAQNREHVINRLNDLVEKNLAIKKTRHATKPSFSSQLRRLETKRKSSLQKRARKGIGLF